jgi:hypothetical protein
MSKSLTEIKPFFTFVEGESVVTREAGISEKTGKPLAKREYAVSQGILMANGRLAPSSALKKMTDAKGKELASIQVQQVRAFSNFTQGRMTEAVNRITAGEMQATQCLVKLDEDGKTPAEYVFRIKTAGVGLQKAKLEKELTDKGLDADTIALVLKRAFPKA